MPTGIYKRTEEHKRKNIANLGQYVKKGHIVSEETKEKQRQAKLNNPPSGQFKKGYTMSEETKEKQRQTRLNNPTSGQFKKGQTAGEKNCNWNDGSSFEPYGLEFNNELKEKIRKRYNYRCQECFRHQDELYTKSGRKYKLHIHHIDYNKEDINEENLISLCRSCHMQTNFKREDWTKYFQSKINNG